MTDPFETDFTRNNPDRKPFGKANGADALSLADEYKPRITEAPTEPPVAEPPKTEPPTVTFKHKLDNGTELEAASVEELAKKIEQALKVPALVVTDFDDKPLYQAIEFKPRELTVQEQADILNVWKENPQKAMKILEEANLGAPVEEVLKQFQTTQTLYRFKLEEEAAADFLGEAETYNPTPANGKKLTAYLNSKGKPITKNNLLKAFADLSSTDKTMIRITEAEPVTPPAEPKPAEPALEEHPAPPSHMPANMGAREEAPKPGVDVEAFSKLSIGQQKEYFANLKRKPN